MVIAPQHLVMSFLGQSGFTVYLGGLSLKYQRINGEMCYYQIVKDT